MSRQALIGWKRKDAIERLFVQGIDDGSILKVQPVAGERLIKRYFNLMPACDPDRTNYKATSLQLREQQRGLDKVYNLQYETHYITEASLAISTQQINALEEVAGASELDQIVDSLPTMITAVIDSKVAKPLDIAADKLTLA